MQLADGTRVEFGPREASSYVVTFACGYCDESLQEIVTPEEMERLNMGDWRFRQCPNHEGKRLHQVVGWAVADGAGYN